MAHTGSFTNLTRRDDAALPPWITSRTVQAGSEVKDNIIVYYNPDCAHCEDMLAEMKARGPPRCVDRMQFVEMRDQSAPTKNRMAGLPSVFVRGKIVADYKDIYTYPA